MIDDLLDRDRERYKSDDDYIQVARDLIDESPNATLDQVWSGTKQYNRAGLKIDELIKSEDDYIQVARDLIDESPNATLDQVWSGTKQYKGGLNRPVNLPLGAFDKTEELIFSDRKKYEGREGYIRLAQDLIDEGFKVTPDQVWSAARKHRDDLNWTDKS